MQAQMSSSNTAITRVDEAGTHGLIRHIRLVTWTYHRYLFCSSFRIHRLVPHLRSLTPSSRCLCSTPHCTTLHYTTLHHTTLRCRKCHMLHGTSNLHLDALLLFNSMGFTIAIQRNKTAYVCWCHVPSWILCVSSLPGSSVAGPASSMET